MQCAEPVVRPLNFFLPWICKINGLDEVCPCKILILRMLCLSIPRINYLGQVAVVLVFWGGSENKAAVVSLPPTSSIAFRNNSPAFCGGNLALWIEEVSGILDCGGVDIGNELRGADFWVLILHE